MFSFRKRKVVVDATPHMRRIIDLTTPNLLVQDEERHDRRYNRALAACICPWENGKADHQSMTLGITKDVSDLGVCVLTTTPLGDHDLALAFLVETNAVGELSFFRATIQRERILVGFIEYGLSLSEYLNDNHVVETRELEGLIRNSNQQEFAQTKESHAAERHPKSWR